MTSSSTTRAQGSTDKSKVENLRKPLSKLVATLLIGSLIFVQPREFGTPLMGIVKLIGYLLVFAGALGRILCTLYIGGRKNQELCQSGIYAICRNPLYFFSFLGLIGLCLAAQNITLTLVSGVLFLILYRVVILSEESKLMGVFPNDLPAYMQKVPRFWPQSLTIKDSQIISVSTKTFNRSLSEVLWFLGGLIGVETINLLRAHGMIHTLFTWY
jgi:protein-S-isoprenylcysteine O-methyltransferase Ste14